MAVHNIQVTIGATPTRVTTTRTPCKEVTIQNNAGNVARAGDSTTTSSIGIRLATVGLVNSSYKWGPFESYALNLEDFYIAGTQNDVIDVSYVQ